MKIMLTVFIILNLLEAIGAVICLPVAIINKDPFWITLGIIFAVASIAQVIYLVVAKPHNNKAQNNRDDDHLYNNLSEEQLAMIDANKEKSRKTY